MSSVKKCGRCGKPINEITDSIIYLRDTNKTDKVYVVLSTTCGCYKVWEKLCRKVKREKLSNGLRFDFEDNEKQMRETLSNFLRKEETFVLS